jgi:protein TonB
MLGKYTNLVIFLAAGGITLVTVVGVTFVFPPSGDDYFGRREPIIIEVPNLLDEEPPPLIYVDEAPPPPYLPPPPTRQYVSFFDYDTGPVIVKEYRPVYPDDARKKGIEGDVILLVFIDERGDVKNVVVQSSPGLSSLERAATMAAYRCKFKPALLDGEPIGVWYSIVMQFEL